VIFAIIGWVGCLLLGLKLAWDGIRSGHGMGWDVWRGLQVLVGVVILAATGWYMPFEVSLAFRA
jgi:hypothetical protein